jgi:hypothetical protein
MSSRRKMCRQPRRGNLCVGTETIGARLMKPPSPTKTKYKRPTAQVDSTIVPGRPGQTARSYCELEMTRIAICNLNGVNGRLPVQSIVLRGTENYTTRTFVWRLASSGRRVSSLEEFSVVYRDKTGQDVPCSTA